MPSDSSKSSGLLRITFSLDPVDEKVIDMMANKRQVSRSEIVRNLVHNWIEGNPEILKSNYSIDLNDVSREIEIEDMEKYFEEKIQKLVEYSRLFEEIDLNILAEQLEVSRKNLTDLIFENQDKLSKMGVKLTIRKNLVVKT
ncbi:MAG: ribbon-helix-helix domain-containing protein [Promethearchaeota archaeon]